MNTAGLNALLELPRGCQRKIQQINMIFSNWLKDRNFNGIAPRK